MFDATEVRPTVLNALIITAIVLITIPLGKVLTQRMYVPGLTELFAAM